MHSEPFPYQAIISESLPSAPVISGLRGAKFGYSKKNPIKALTFWQLTLQCCHHSLTQFHSPPRQFIQNQALIHRLSHQLYAHCHHPWKVYIQCFRKLIFLWLAIIFSPIWKSKWCNRKWSGSLPSSEGSSFWNRFHLAVFQDNKSRVRGMNASFWEWCQHNHEEQGPRSPAWNVLRQKLNTTGWRQTNAQRLHQPWSPWWHWKHNQRTAGPAGRRRLVCSLPVLSASAPEDTISMYASLR